MLRISICFTLSLVLWRVAHVEEALPLRLGEISLLVEELLPLAPIVGRSLTQRCIFADDAHALVLDVARHTFCSCDDVREVPRLCTIEGVAFQLFGQQCRGFLVQILHLLLGCARRGPNVDVVHPCRQECA